MAVCLVTGGAGFLGSHLVEALVADRHVVRVVDNFTTGSMDHLAAVMDAVELYPGDCADPAFLYRVMRGVELVFHLGGAAPEGPRGGAWPQSRGDASGTLRLLSVASEAQVRRVLFASSLHVYGGSPTRPVDEADLTEPDSPYGRAKLSGEQAYAICTRASGLETVRLRYFHVFGPRQPADGPYAAVVPAALAALLAGGAAVAADAEAAQDLIYVEDAVHATLLAATASRVAGKVYNIARGRPTTTREVVQTLNELLGTSIEPAYAGPPGRGPANLVAGVRRAEVDLGFCAATDLRQGLSRYLHHVPALAPRGRKDGHRAPPTLAARVPRGHAGRGFARPHTEAGEAAPR
jgi:UDP-glucose 4-epimerase